MTEEQPKKKGCLGRGLMFVVIAILVVIVIMVIAGIASPEDEDAAAPAPSATKAVAATAETSKDAEAIQEKTEAETGTAPAAESTEKPKPTATPEVVEQELYLGDAVAEDGFAVVALAVEDPTTPGMFYTAEPGTKLIAVEIIVANLTRETLSCNPLNASLLDTEGFAYQVELAGRDEQLLAVDLRAGEKARGWVAFKIPEGVTPAKLKYSPGMFSSTTLAVSLAPAPEGHEAITGPLAVTPEPPRVGLGGEASGFGCSLSASTVEDPSAAGMFYEARPGYRLVAVEITVGNVSAESFSANPLYAYLIDADGYVYEPELGGRDGQLDAIELAKGEKAKGWVSFELPDGAQPAALKYQTEPLSSNWIVVGLAP